MAKNVTGTFTGTANGNAFTPGGCFNVSVYGTFVGTVVLERSFDAGTTWVPVLRPSTGTAVSYTAPSSEVLGEPEKAASHRLRCSAYTSGTVSYRLAN